jgi:hypothetical protein
MRYRSCLVLVLCLAGCQSAEKASVQPLPAGGPPLTYADIVLRGKNQVSYAHESFYRDQWDEVKRAATAMKETSTQLGTLEPESVPLARRAQFAKLAKEWAEAADHLQTSGQAKDADKTTAAFTKLHLVIRQLLVE